LNASYTPRTLPGIDPEPVAVVEPPAPREPAVWTVIAGPVVRPAELIVNPYCRHEGLLNWHLDHLRHLAAEIIQAGDEESRELLRQFVDSTLDLEVA